MTKQMPLGPDWAQIDNGKVEFEYMQTIHKL